LTTSFPVLSCDDSRRNPASSALVGTPNVNWFLNSSAIRFFRRRAVWLSRSSLLCVKLNDVRNSSWGKRCIPTSRRHCLPGPPGHCSTRSSIAFQPRRLKYPTQKSERSATSSVPRSAGSRFRPMLSKMRGMDWFLLGRSRAATDKPWLVSQVHDREDRITTTWPIRQSSRSPPAARPT